MHYRNLTLSLIGDMVQQFSAKEVEKVKSITLEKQLDEVAPVETKPAPRPIHYTSLSTFSWDEESDKVKV